MASDSRASGGFGRRLETLLLTLLLLGIVVLAALQIVLRNVFSYSIFWADDLIRIAVLWIAMVGGMAASRESRHIAIGIVPRYFPPAWHGPAAIIAASFAAVVSAVLAWQSGRFVLDSYSYGDSLQIGWPAWPVQVVMPVGFAVIAWRFATDALAAWRGTRR